MVADVLFCVIVMTDPKLLWLKATPATKNSKVVVLTEQGLENFNSDSAAGFCACSFIFGGFWKMQLTPPTGLSPSAVESPLPYSTMELLLSCPRTMGKFDEGGGSKDDLRC